jgi:hypothetical protein
MAGEDGAGAVHLDACTADELQRRLEALGLTVDATRLNVAMQAFACASVDGPAIAAAAFFRGGFTKFVADTVADVSPAVFRRRACSVQ